MATINVNLISGRSVQQGVAIEGGKEKPLYRTAADIIEFDLSDLRNGAWKNTNVRVTSDHGSVIVKAIETTQGPHPGVAFIPMGPWANSIIDPNTYPLPSALKDRMEVISLPGYTDLEKLKIARTFLLPRQMEENGINSKILEISDPAILLIISQYTQEAGLRNLEREFASICRKVARRVAEGNKEKTKINTKNLH